VVRKDRVNDCLRRLITLGVSQKEIAAEVKVHPSTINRILNDPNWYVSQRLAKRVDAFVAERVRCLKRLLR
jgi:plasmid maintenance system antidote protein VapI